MVRYPSLRKRQCHGVDSDRCGTQSNVESDTEIQQINKDEGWISPWEE